MKNWTETKTINCLESRGMKNAGKNINSADPDKIALQWQSVYTVLLRKFSSTMNNHYGTQPYIDDHSNMGSISLFSHKHGNFLRKDLVLKSIF